MLAPFFELGRLKKGTLSSDPAFSTQKAEFLPLKWKLNLQKAFYPIWNLIFIENLT